MHWHDHQFLFYYHRQLTQACLASEKPPADRRQTNVRQPVCGFVYVYFSTYYSTTVASLLPHREDDCLFGIFVVFILHRVALPKGKKCAQTRTFGPVNSRNAISRRQRGFTDMLPMKFKRSTTVLSPPIVSVVIFSWVLFWFLLGSGVSAVQPLTVDSSCFSKVIITTTWAFRRWKERYKTWHRRRAKHENACAPLRVQWTCSRLLCYCCCCWRQFWNQKLNLLKVCSVCVSRGGTSSLIVGNDASLRLHPKLR